MHTLASNAGKRAHGINPIEAGGALAGGGGLAAAAHNPWLILAGPAYSMARHAATSPEALAAEARFLNSSGARGAARATPQVLVEMWRQLRNKPEL
jgi:hypothetical protein